MRTSLRPPRQLDGPDPATCWTVLLLTFTAILIGCGETGRERSAAEAPAIVGSPGASAAQTGNAGGDAPATAGARAGADPPPPVLWEPSELEVQKDVKRLAARTAQALATYSRGTRSEQILESLGIESGEPLAEIADPEARSSGRVIYPQLVGLGAAAAAITVLLEQTRMYDEGAEVVETRSLDIRLRLEEQGWRVTGLAASGGRSQGPPSELSPEARAVLENPRIHLPDTARWDIYRGAVHTDLLRLLSSLAERHELHVLTFVSGRPRYVFGTDRLSNHASGRAADIWAIDGIPVVEQRHEDSPVHRAARWLFELGIPELGSPWAFDGFGGRSFTDAVHQDHLHVAVEGR